MFGNYILLLSIFHLKKTLPQNWWYTYFIVKDIKMIGFGRHFGFGEHIGKTIGSFELTTGDLQFKYFWHERDN